MIGAARPRAPEEVAHAPAPRPRFRVGDVVGTVGGTGAYTRGEIVGVAHGPRYYRVDFGPGVAVLVREENLEPFDGNDLLSEPPGSFVPPVPPHAWAFGRKSGGAAVQNHKCGPRLRARDAKE